MATPMRDAEYEKRKDEAKLLIAAGGCSAIKFWSNTDATRLCPADHKKEVGLDPLEAPIYVSEWLEAAKKAVELISKGIALLEPAAPSSPSLDSLKTGVEDGFTKEEIALQKQHTEMLEDKLTRLDADYMMLVRQRVWMACEEHMPDEGGRYWCYCTEINDLGTSHFQWNCYYDPQNKSFSDEGHSISVTHWKPLAPPPISFPPIPSKEPGELDRVIESVAGDCPKREENSWYEKMKSEYKKGIIAAREVWFYVGKHITKEQYYEIVGQEVDGKGCPINPLRQGTRRSKRRLGHPWRNTGGTL
jgi:hypothetical protein